ncbi:MAG: glycosyltransferase N-terminal domain-containing protein [Planctomycetota bacterium]|nr:glycosyltransferase N-terminal domain-containing protein [Planctomycetota bacterium]
MSIILDAVYLLVVIGTSPWWMRKQRGGWRERFGRIEPLPAKRRKRIVVHAVSVGEVNLTRPFVEALRRSCEIVVTTTTDTGMARARSIYSDMPDVWVRRYPLDASWSVRRFLDAAAPDGVVLVELELWPNFLRACERREIPVCVVNGRLSERSFARYRRVRWLFQRWFGRLAFAATQDEAYAERFRAMGAKDVRVGGNMKWDSAHVVEGDARDLPGAAALAREMGIDRDMPLIVGGSTAPEEHALLIDATPNGVQLLCAPRRPEWFDDAAAALEGCVRRSATKTGSTGGGSSTGRFLLDTIGELRNAYALADVVVIGRSFGALYGSDPMEAAGLGKPVIIGPRVSDFASVVETMEQAGAIIRTTPERLRDDVARLLGDEGERRALGEQARACVKANQGAAARQAAMVLSMIGMDESARLNAVEAASVTA